MIELQHLRCFVAAAEELHFGRAAQRLGMLPATFGRHIRRLEEVLGSRVMARTTRSVTLTCEGAVLLAQARDLIAQADALATRFRQTGRCAALTLKIGAIDSAAAGLIPPLLHDFKLSRPDVTVQLVEDKTARLLPRLLSGRLDLAFVRPPDHMSPRLASRHLVDETPVVVVPSGHHLAARDHAELEDLMDDVLIVPERRSRPHSHDLTVKLFANAGLHPRIAQIADEKQTIVNLVAAGLGAAIVPSWTSKIVARGVAFVPLARSASASARRLPLSAVWLRDARDPARDAMLATLKDGLPAYIDRA